LSLAGAILLVAGASTVMAEEPAKACGARGDLTDLIACLRSAYGRTDAAEPRTCAGPLPDFLAPVEGRRILGFGARTTYGGASKGTVIESATGTPVSAPAAGFVLFAGEWRSYGTLVVIDAGCATHALVAGVAALTVAAGDQVDRGGRIGEVPSPPTPADLPVVYFEVRRNGAPIDPEP
jgi:septal ring factor EnvC (AmiA/AmiB activator)